MEINPEIVHASSLLANHVGKKSVGAIFDKIRAIKEKGAVLHLSMPNQTERMPVSGSG